MLDRFDASSPIKPGMEIITKDGRRAGYVANVSRGEIIARFPARQIPLSLIRRVDNEDVYIEPRLAELKHPSRDRTYGRLALDWMHQLAQKLR
jgi:hypothetical protein